MHDKKKLKKALRDYTELVTTAHHCLHKHEKEVELEDKFLSELDDYVREVVRESIREFALEITVSNNKGQYAQ